jgi:predicted NBD/HSP70 family sugar kinase
LTSNQAATGPQVLRQINERAVLDCLRHAASMRLSDLIAATGLSRPAVTRAVASLREAGWLTDADEPDRGLGRPAQRVRFRAERGHVLGIDAGPHNVRVRIADLAGRAVAEHKIENASGAWPAEDVLAAITRATDEVLATAGLGRSDIWSVGAGTPGIVDDTAGLVTLAPSIRGWAGLSVGRELRNRFDCPVYLDNEANLSALAESWAGVASGSGTLLFVQWGARIGLGILIGGRVHRGSASGAGELGFADLVTPLDAPVDGPGPAADGPADRMGAFERVVGAAAIVELAVAEAAADGDEELRAAVTTPDQSHNAAAFFAAAARGDNAAAARALDRVAARFARGIAIAALVVDPELIVIGGGVSQCGAPLLAAVERHLHPLLLTAPRLELSALGDGSVAIGGIRRALDEVEARLA